MFLFNKKKIRKLAEDLDATKRPEELTEVVRAIEANAPESARPVFKNKLRQELMLKHKSFNISQNMKENSKKESNAEKKPAFSGSHNRAWAFATAFLIILVVSGAISYPLIPAPQVDGYSLKENVRTIAYNAPVKVLFNQAMDRGSVEASFHIEPKVEGRFEWQNNSLLFYPANSFKVGDTFAVTVEKKAKSIFQKSLPYDYEENFEISGPPQVILFNPAQDSQNIDTSSKITVLFDRPMTALTTLENGQALMPQINIDPPATGKFKWLGTNSVTFIPDRLQNATKYTVTVPKGTTSADGGKTDQDFTASFTTLQPAIVQTIPYDMDTYNGPDTKIFIDFNQKMDPANAKQYLHFYFYKNGALSSFTQGAAPLLDKIDAAQWQEMPFDIRYSTLNDYKDRSSRYLPFAGEGMATADDSQVSESDLQKTIVMIPTSKLAYDSTFFVKIDKGMPGSEGVFLLEQPQGTVFKTVGEVKVASTNLPSSGSRPTSYAEIDFAHPMDSESVISSIVLSPLKKDKDTGQEIKPTINSENDMNFGIVYSFEPSMDYTITVKAGAKDKFGQSLKTDYSEKFKTPPLTPNLLLQSNSNINILDVNKQPVFYLKSTNIDVANFNFKKLTKEEFLSLYGTGYISSNDNLYQGPYISWEKKISNEFNKEVVTKIDFSAETGQKLEPGIYYFDVSTPKVTNEYNKQPLKWRNVFIFTGTALATKWSSEELLVWGTSLKDGKPVQDLAITVRNRNGEKMLTGTTDSNGLASFKLPKAQNETDFYNNDYTVEAEGDGGYTMVHTSWADGVEPWNFNIGYDYFQPDYFVYPYTDRPIYRPGDTVYFKGLVRKDADAVFKLPDLKKVHVAVKDSQYETVYEKDLDLNSNGTYNDNYTLGAQARTGNYSIETTIPGAPGPEYLNKFYAYFRIAEYRKPDYELNLTADKENYINGDKAKIAVKGAYFFGAPLPNARIEYTVRSQDYYFFLDSTTNSPYASQWYSFSEEGYFCYFGCEAQNEVVSSGKAQLNANGEYVLDVPLDISKKKVSQFYTVEVTAFDLNNQSVSNRVILPVHRGEFYTGIMNQDYIVNQGDPAKFNVISVDFDGQPLSGKQIDVSFYKRNWNTVQKKNVDSEFYYENSYEDTFVEKKTVTTDEKGYAEADFTAKDGGMFKATSSAKDSKGNTIVSSTTVYVTSGDFVNWGRENNDKIEIVADKNEYKPGDTAKLLVKSPYQNVWALVTQERKGILDRKVVLIKSNSETIEIPITEKSIPNIFVSVLLVKGDATAAGLTEPGAGSEDERSVAAFKLGYATLQVNTSSKILKIDATPDKQKYHPGDEVILKVKTSDNDGKPVKGEVSISVVDKSVLSLTESVTADLLNAFYRQRFLGVSTAETLTKAISRINVQVEAGMKGGGGAKAVKRGVFKDTAYWQAVLDTDANGEGTLKFKLPDNLTTWQILAIGITDDTLVGSQKSEFLVTKDVLVRAVLPRFLIVNDTMKVGGIVHNYLESATDFDVTLEASGADITSEKTVRITLNPGEEKKVEWDISVLDGKEAVFTFKALAANDQSTGDILDANDQSTGDILEQKLPVEPYSFPEVVATSGTITDDKKQVETVWLPIGIDPTHGELKISMAPTLANSISQGLEYLMTFPYGCSEQTTSSLLPNVVIKQVLNLPALSNTLVDQKQLTKNVEAGVAALYKLQQDNGSWGVWQNSSPSPYLTAYVLFALNETQKAGYAVDAGVITRARDYLKNYLNSNPLVLKETPTTDPYVKSENRYQANIRAYVLYVLSEIGGADLAMSNNLYDYRDDLNLFAKAYLAMTYKSIGDSGSLDASVKGDLGKKIEALKNDILNQAKETPRGVHFEESNREYRLFDTNTRTTALVLQMLSRIEPENPYIPKILRNLLMEKKDGRYLSTQETAITLLALVDYLKNSKELEPAYNAILAINDSEKLNKTYKESNIGDKDVLNIPLTDLQQNNQDNEIAFSKSGVGKIYYDINLRYFLPTERIEPREEGIVITQEYFGVDDTKMENPLNSAVVGQNLKGKMTVIVPEDRYYVMVEDYLPAGLEGVDFSLKTSQTNLLQQNSVASGKGGFDNNMWAFNYNEVRDDRMMFFADYLPKGVYELEYFVRATSPGKFHDLPALAQELYFPEVFGRSEGKIFEVKE